MIEYIAFFIWTVASIFVLTFVIGLFYKPESDVNPTIVDVVMVTVGKYNVRNALFEVLENLRNLGLEPTVLTEEGAELVLSIKDGGYNVVEVPKKYRRDLVGKGRAIQYFIENYVNEDRWYSFLDDDNILMDLNFLYEIPAMERKGYVAMNPILVPRLGRSKMTYVMDWVRYLDDVSIFRFFTGVLEKPLIGLHGELLTVKGSVLKELGFDTPSITEDFLFASKLVSKGYKTWQSRTKVSILSPNSLKDFMKQRSRWYKGIVMDLMKDIVPFRMKAVVGLRVFIWTIGIFGSWALMPLWFYWGVWWFSIPSAIAYWSTYAYGVYRLGDWKYILLVPAYSVIEAISWVYALKERGFVVIDKN